MLDGFKLVKQLLKPLPEAMDMAPMFLTGNYVLGITSPKKFGLIHEKNGMRFTSAEVRPNGRDFLERFGEAVEQRQERDQAGPVRPDNGIEM